MFLIFFSNSFVCKVFDGMCFIPVFMNTNGQSCVTYTTRQTIVQSTIKYDIEMNRLFELAS